MDLVTDPGKYTRATTYGAAKYVKNLEFDKKTGKAISEKKHICLDTDRLAEEEKYDGYYSIVTSELHMTDEEIIETYRGLWEIEHTFKITKSTLAARPVFVSLEDRINAHFLTCFISLMIIRLIQRQIGMKYSVEQIIECLNKISCSNEQDNLYLFDYRSDISDAIGDVLGINLTRKRLRLSEIKNILANCKK